MFGSKSGSSGFGQSKFKATTGTTKTLGLGLKKLENSRPHAPPSFDNPPPNNLFGVAKAGKFGANSELVKKQSEEIKREDSNPKIEEKNEEIPKEDTKTEKGDKKGSSELPIEAYAKIRREQIKKERTVLIDDLITIQIAKEFAKLSQKEKEK